MLYVCVCVFMGCSCFRAAAAGCSDLCADELRPLLQVRAKTLRVFSPTGSYLVPEQAEGMPQPEAGS